MEADPDLELSPGGESVAAFHRRVGAALTRIAAAHAEQTVVIACHGGVVDVGLRTLLDLAEWSAAFDLYTQNTVDHRVRARARDANVGPSGGGASFATTTPRTSPASAESSAQLSPSIIKS